MKRDVIRPASNDILSESLYLEGYLIRISALKFRIVEKEGIPALVIGAISSTQLPHPALKPCQTAICKEKQQSYIFSGK